MSVKLPYSSIKTAWDHFVRSVFKTGVSTIQKQEMEKAFFAGASSCFDIMTFPANANETDEEGVARMEKLLEEFQQYAKKLQSVSGGKS